VAPATPDADTLSRISLFKWVPTRQLERLAPLMHERIFSTGANILTAEQPGETVYVLIKGSEKAQLFTPTEQR
jgi:signal-transduction protein with cAMP-binding, CBS, and nucleotidyltransferase domain